jgi:ATP-dependent helicase HrpB
MYRDLILREERHGSASDAEAAEALGQVLKRKATQILAADESASKLLARIELLRHAMPEKSWPAFDAAAVGDLLSQLSLGKRSVSAVIANGALATAIKSQLAYPLDRILDAEAPESIEVPSGSNIRITYAPPADDGKPPAAPILAVRLQELFGWTQTPRIAGGRVPLLLHLLSPAYRPVQITSDLASFWNKAYFSVRKDLRADYPKHSWPEDPLTAKAEAKGRRRQS